MSSVDAIEDLFMILTKSFCLETYEEGEELLQIIEGTERYVRRKSLPRRKNSYCLFLKNKNPKKCDLSIAR